ncbi:MAG TPA: PP2C family protein-serine/threonine phosphatase [Planctomycetota bacterium]
MSEKSGSTHKMRIHARDKDFTLFVRRRGVFTLLAPSGRYTEALLLTLAQDYLGKPGYYALDLTALDAVTLPLIRCVRDYAENVDPARGRVVFVNPPDRILALLKLVDPKGRLPVTYSERDLDGDLAQVEGRVSRAEDRLHLVRTMLSSHPCWQLTDPESRWLCPFCVTLRPDIRFVLRGTPSQAVVTRVLRHLGEECSTYVEGATDGWPFEVLERVIKYGHEHATPAPAPAAAPAPAPPDDRRRRLLPRVLAPIEGCAVEIYSRAATPLTGDFFDVLKLPDGRRAVLVGDVSGGGIEPGVLMGAARKLLSLRLREIPDLSEALARANDDLCDELDQESYVSVAVAIPDPKKGELWIARAGHPAPFLARGSDVARLESPGPVLGFVPTASFEQGIEARRYEMKRGDVLLLHTDGLEELRGVEGERFGAERVAEITRAHAAMDVKMILGALVLDAEQFAGTSKRAEDVTAVCVKAL